VRPAGDVAGEPAPAGDGAIKVAVIRETPAAT
jgi:hypothetical protein